MFARARSIMGLAIVLLGTVGVSCGCGKRRAAADAAAVPAGSPSSPAVAAAPAPGAQGTPEDALAEPPAEGMAPLRPDDKAITVSGVSVTWREIQRAVGWPKEGASLTKAPVEKARALVQQFVQRSLLLAEARRRGLTVTEEEKAAHLATLEQALKASGETLEEYLKEFPDKPSSPLEISLADTLLVVKLGGELVRDVTVTDAEFTLVSAQITGMRNAILEGNAQTRRQMEELAARPEAATDAGFAALAKEHSQGREAPTGGVAGSFTRKQIASVNGGQPFSLAPGETSGLIETDTSFRILRVLELVPAEKGSDEERVKVAQILMRKNSVPEPMTREELTQSIKREKEQVLLKERTDALAQAADISCPLFPGLYPK